MYRFILAIILIIVLSISLKYILFEKFSVNQDNRVLTAILKNNDVVRNRRKQRNTIAQDLNRYRNIKDMETVVENLREKVLSAKEIMNLSLPTCRKIDLYPNIDFTSAGAERDNRFLSNSETSLRMRQDLTRGDRWDGHAYGQCSNYNSTTTSTDQEVNRNNSNCRMDPYCQVVRDEQATATKGFRCDYKTLNHDCYNSSNGTPVDIYFNPETLNNI